MAEGQKRVTTGFAFLLTTDERACPYLQSALHQSSWLWRAADAPGGVRGPKVEN